MLPKKLHFVETIIYMLQQDYLMLRILRNTIGKLICLKLFIYIDQLKIVFFYQAYYAFVHYSGFLLYLEYCRALQIYHRSYNQTFRLLRIYLYLLCFSRLSVQPFN